MAAINLLFFCLANCFSAATSIRDVKFLIENKFIGYNRLTRPVMNESEVISVKLGLRLTQLLDVHERAQIVKTKVWLKQEWTDKNFQWDPREYEGIETLHIPVHKIWVPHIVLYNNADGNYEIQIMTKARVSYNGSVVWEPPAIYRSMCEMQVRWFPFDEQRCELKFGSWTYDASEVDLIFFTDNYETLYTSETKNTTRVTNAIDIRHFNPSVEWDLMEVPSERHVVRYGGAETKYVDITFYLDIRRMTLFYTVNLIIPCVGLSLLTALVFYLPSDCREKVVLTVSILISLTLFFLLLIDIIPSTSIEMPLIGTYLLFTMTHRLPHWVKKVFIHWLPPLLQMRRPENSEIQRKIWRKKSMVVIPRIKKYSMSVSSDQWSDKYSWCHVGHRGSEVSNLNVNPDHLLLTPNTNPPTNSNFLMPPSIGEPGSRRVSMESWTSAGFFAVNQVPLVEMEDPVAAGINNTTFISAYFKKKTLHDDAREDWRYIAKVFDRLFLWIFCLMCVGGSVGIVLRAPVIFDTRVPLTQHNFTHQWG